MNKKRCLYGFIFAALFFVKPVQAQFPYQESFRKSVAPGIRFGGFPTAFLTGGAGPITGPGLGYNDPVGEGYLRLTNNALNQKGFIYSESVFPSTYGLRVEFEYYTYGGTGADGLTFFLFDATASPFNIGGFGGSLGYSPISTTSPVSPGISKGYIGIGLDEFGNFSNGNEGRQGGIGRKAGSVTLRGKGDGSGLTAGNYPYLTSVQTNSLGFTLTPANNASIRYASTTDAGYRRAFIDLKHNPAGGYNVTVKIMTGGPVPKTYTVINGYHYQQAAPANLKYGFASSTGSQTNFHEIRNVYIDIYGNNPLGNDDVDSTSANVPVNIPVRDNDISKTSTVIIQKVPLHGTLIINADGTVKYTPVLNYDGKDVFTYILKDGQGLLSDPITVTVYINPAGSNDLVFTLLNTPKVISVKDNDISKGTTVIKISDPVHGSALLNADGTIKYSPEDGYSGKDSLTYILKNADGQLSVVIKVNITIYPPPKIGLAKQLAKLVKGNNGGYEATFLFTLVNYGEDIIEKVVLWDDLEKSFEDAQITIKSIDASGTLIANNGFDGKTNLAVLLPASTLAAGSEEKVTLTVTINGVLRNGIYTNTAFLEGVSAIDKSKVSDESQDGLVPDPLEPGDVSPSDPTPIDLKKQNLFIPQGFSPNHDGVNDYFVIRREGGKSPALDVYNRWGNRVFKDGNYENNWDGKCTEGIHIGDDLPAGTYYYIIVFANDEKYTGYITLNR
ncbi:MAG: gliding motility-associated C-terminal domain-containing protein [Sphingobacteriaceae bacterium]